MFSILIIYLLYLPTSCRDICECMLIIPASYVIFVFFWPKSCMLTWRRI